MHVIMFCYSRPGQVCTMVCYISFLIVGMHMYLSHWTYKRRKWLGKKSQCNWSCMSIWNLWQPNMSVICVCCCQFQSIDHVNFAATMSQWVWYIRIYFVHFTISSEKYTSSRSGMTQRWSRDPLICMCV